MWNNRLIASLIAIASCLGVASDVYAIDSDTVTATGELKIIATLKPPTVTFNPGTAGTTINPGEPLATLVFTSGDDNTAVYWINSDQSPTGTFAYTSTTEPSSKVNAALIASDKDLILLTSDPQSVGVGNKTGKFAAGGQARLAFVSPAAQTVSAGEYRMTIYVVASTS